MGPPHVCANTEVRTARLLLALHVDDETAYRVVVREIGDCTRCWKAVALWATILLAGARLRAAGSKEKAADYVADELSRLIPT